MNKFKFYLGVMSGFISRMTSIGACIASHKQADPDALASALFIGLLAREINNKQLDVLIDLSGSITIRIPCLANCSRSGMLGLSIVEYVSENQSVCLVDTCERNLAFVPQEHEDESRPIDIIGSLDHHLPLRAPTWPNIFLPASSTSRPLAELGFHLFPPSSTEWTCVEWGKIAGLLAIGIATDGGFTVPYGNSHIWDLKSLPHGSPEDIKVFHMLANVRGARAILQDFERAQLSILSEISEFAVEIIDGLLAVVDFGRISEMLRGMIGAKVDMYLNDRRDLVCVTAIYHDGNAYRYSARSRVENDLIYKLTSTVCGRQGSVKDSGRIAGGVLIDGIGMPEMCDVVRTLIKHHGFG